MKTVAPIETVSCALVRMKESEPTSGPDCDRQNISEPDGYEALDTEVSCIEKRRIGDKVSTTSNRDDI